MLDYTNMKTLLEIAEGKSALKSGPVEFEDILIERGMEIRKNAAGTYSILRFEVVGFASSKTLVAYWDGNLDGFDEYDDDIKAMPAVIMKTKGWEQYEIMSAQDAVGMIRTNRYYDEHPVTPLG